MGFASDFESQTFATLPLDRFGGGAHDEDMNNTATAATITALAAWQDAEHDPNSGHDIWTDVILGFAGYDADATSTLDESEQMTSSAFVADGTVFAWCEQDAEWQTRSFAGLTIAAKAADAARDAEAEIAQSTRSTRCD